MATIFAIVLSGLAAIVLITLAVLLLVRYVALGILLILLPLAWLTWIFPSFKSNFSKWWSEFIKWAFFPPLALFFVYLAFVTAVKGTASGQQYLSTAAAIPNNAASGVEGALGIGIGTVDPITQAVNEILLVALMMGGVFAASSLSGKYDLRCFCSSSFLTRSVIGSVELIAW